LSDPIVSIQPLGFVWETNDPFLFCVHHDDAYPAGTERMAPAASLAGRNLGQDFEGKDGWRMYHGRTIPGFPAHPHRGFETITVMRKGFIDHSDSLGSAARFGPGDVQWMTAGEGVVHSEMFPMLQTDRPNPLELFQIWINLPAEDKMVPPHFAMLWAEHIPVVNVADANGVQTEVTVIAGRYGDATPPAPPPRSWASRADTDVAIWSIRMPAGARWTLPAAAASSTRRTLNLFAGGAVTVAGQRVAPKVGIRLRPDQDVLLETGDAPAELLLLQGRPIAQPVAQHGPFVMNNRQELQQAFSDYQRTRFGGWPWGGDDPVHPRDAGRFARHSDGRVERM
jgi:redox-sensitive bicupin YhaK (pirin superfamily)